jgi:hypothetical protein
MLENEIVHGSHTFDKVNYLFVSVNTNTGIYRIDKDRSGHFHGKQYLSEGKVIEALNDLKKVMVTNKTKSTIITSNFNPNEDNKNKEKSINLELLLKSNSLKDIVQTAINSQKLIKLKKENLRGIGKTAVLVEEAINKGLNLVVPTFYQAHELKEKHKELNVFSLETIRGEKGIFIFDEGVNVSKLINLVGLSNIVTGLIYEL